jgi:hypothetical protein
VSFTPLDLFRPHGYTLYHPACTGVCFFHFKYRDTTIQRCNVAKDRSRFGCAAPLADSTLFPSQGRRMTADAIEQRMRALELRVAELEAARHATSPAEVVRVSDLHRRWPVFSESTWKKFLSDGRLPSVKIGSARARLVRVDDVVALLADAKAATESADQLFSFIGSEGQQGSTRVNEGRQASTTEARFNAEHTTARRSRK